MLNSINWRLPAAYQYTERIHAAGFAWEYLRRDDDYHRDFQRIVTIEGPAAQRLEEFSRRWGLRFSVRPRKPI
jgi:hypothetical protein